MICVPHQFKPLLARLSSATARPQTARRLILFFAAAILVIGDRTVSGVLRLLDLITPLNPSTFHREDEKGTGVDSARVCAIQPPSPFCPPS